MQSNSGVSLDALTNADYVLWPLRLLAVRLPRSVLGSSMHDTSSLALCGTYQPYRSSGSFLCTIITPAVELPLFHI